MTMTETTVEIVFPEVEDRLADFMEDQQIVDTGDFVIVLNAEKVRLTGNKLSQKKYYRHSGYTGSLTTITADKLLEKAPEELIRKAVKGMLPKNKLGRQMYRKLKVYCGANHPHQAQQPKELQV